jgi:hypothetical protein
MHTYRGRRILGTRAEWVALAIWGSFAVTSPAAQNVQPPGASGDDEPCLVINADRVAERLTARDLQASIREADLIWTRYGVHVAASPRECPGRPSRVWPLQIEILASEDATAPDAIGRTTFCVGRPQGPIRIHADTAVRFVRQRPRLGLYRDDPFEERNLLRIVVARVLAHEVGHVLLGPEHTSVGLMHERLSWFDGVHLAADTVTLTWAQRARVAERVNTVLDPTDQILLTSAPVVSGTPQTIDRPPR